MKRYKDIFSFKTFWGRYLIFSILALLFSCGVFASDNPNLTNNFVGLSLHYLGSHIIYWVVYGMISLQFMMINKSQFSFSFYTRIATFLIALVGIASCSLGIFNSFKHGSLYSITQCSFGLAFLLASYHLYLDRKTRFGKVDEV